MKQVRKEEIQQFLEGRDPQKYIVAIEASYSSQNVDLIINHPENGKYSEKHSFRPFLWAKSSGIMKLCNGDMNKISAALNKAKITVRKLKIAHEDGSIPERMENGFKYLVEGSGTYGELLNFFKFNGVDIFDPANRRDFITVSLVEQFMIQSGKRLFKGMDDYDKIHRFQFDLETMGLEPRSKHLGAEDAEKILEEIAKSDNPDEIKKKYRFYSNGRPYIRKGDRIFSIGIRDNRGHEVVLEVEGENEDELDRKELSAIQTFFEIVEALKPDLVAGYNSENFDFDFLKARCEELGSCLASTGCTLHDEIPVKRRPSTVKYGQETEYYEQTLIWGVNVVDIYHSVRRAQAINSDIKKADLKYITKYSKIAKDNRVYVDGDMIYKTWSDKVNKYAHNTKNGDWYKITDKKPLKKGYIETTGREIVNQYLLDDLWETEQIDYSFKQADFLLSKIVPTTYSKVSTMGTASLWKLLMCAWSYDNKLGIPDYEEKRDFTGGLSRLLECGFAIRVIKLDYAALYPNTELTHDIFPEFDISGVMKGMLTYIAETRDEFKELKNVHKARVAEIKEKMAEYEAKGELTPELKAKCEKAIVRHSKIAADADKKQLPIKILANSFFGSFGAPHIFPWGDLNCAEETTCRGRQYLRLLVSHFWENYGFRPLVGDTDGFNFAVPDNVDELEYVGQGLHRFTEKGKVYKGIDAPVAEFNDLHMKGRMGLDIDEVATSTINFARKNYADLIDGDVKLVGNTIKSKKMEVYIEEFFDKGIRLLLEGKGKKFIDFYYEYVDKIYNYQIPLAKIASKGRVKQTISEYKKKCKQKNKAGNPMPRQAHMELVLAHKLSPDLGDTIYYVNTSSKKGVGDIKSNKVTRDLPLEVGKTYKVTLRGKGEFKIDKINDDDTCTGTFIKKPDLGEQILNVSQIKPDKEFTGRVDVELNCKLIPKTEIDNNPDFTSDEYNVARYLDKFNNRIKPLLVVFNQEIRDEILINIVTDRKTKVQTLEERGIFTKKQCELTAGSPYEESDQDSYEDLMTMEDKEIRFWTSVDKIPNHIDENKWEEIKVDYFRRLELAKEEGINNEKELLDIKFKRLEAYELDEALELIENDQHGFYMWVITKLKVNLDFDEETEEHVLTSFKWDEKLSNVEDIFKYREDAEDRAKFYKTINVEDIEDAYEQYLEYRLKTKGDAEENENEMVDLTLEEYKELSDKDDGELY